MMTDYAILFEWIFFSVPLGWIACDALMKRKWKWVAMGTGLYAFCCFMTVVSVYFLIHAVKP